MIILVYDWNHLFALGSIPKPKFKIWPKLSANTKTNQNQTLKGKKMEFRYRQKKLQYQNWYRNLIMVSVVDTETKFWSYIEFYTCLTGHTMHGSLVGFQFAKISLLSRSASSRGLYYTTHLCLITLKENKKKFQTKKNMCKLQTCLEFDELN